MDHMNVWDMSLWLWRDYVRFLDEHEKQRQEANRGR